MMVGAGFAGARSSQAASTPGPTVLSMKLSGVVDPFEAAYIKRGIDTANSEGDAAVLITIDTPGGLDSSMRDIIKSILGSGVPVICYTAPSGARAASAGTFIMMACPIAAMAPGTNIGAAHPVGVSGVIEQEKVTNDAAAFIRSLAERWHRNADWAESAVRDSESVSAEEAASIHVIDLVSGNTTTLLQQDVGQCHGGSSPPRTTGLLRTAGSLPEVCDATFHAVKMGLGAAFLHALIDPSLAFLFFFLGLVFIVIELLHPGVSVPGILGSLMLVSAFISFGFLPVQLGGLIMLVASAVFFLLELKHPGLGLPTVGGLVFLVMGGLLLFNPSVPNARVSPFVIAVVAAGLFVFFAFVVKAALAARHLPPAAGIEGLVGQSGVALDDLDPSGRVRAGRETWSARSTGGAIPAGGAVRVVRVEGLHLIVEPAEGPAPPPSVESVRELAGRPATGSEGGEGG
jgi:membrane-bound serine protease (ClpP class)